MLHCRRKSRVWATSVVQDSVVSTVSTEATDLSEETRCATKTRDAELVDNVSLGSSRSKDGYRSKTDEGEWKVVGRSKFKDPDVLLVGNSNIRGLDPRFLSPLFTSKHTLQDKTLRGTVLLLKKN